MHMLRIFRLSCVKEEETCHAQFCDNIPEFIFFLKPKCDALPVSRHLFKPRTAIPSKRRQPFSNNIGSPHPALVELRAEKIGPYLLGNDFGFRQFWHGKRSFLMKWAHVSHTSNQPAKQLVFIRCPLWVL